jgi:membrane-bound lytic murein transglycosylase D
MHKSFRVLLILCLVLSTACAKKYQADNQDMKPNLDPELSNPDFLKIRRPRPLTQQEKDVLASKIDIPFNLDVRDNEEVQLLFASFTQEHHDTMVRWLERAAPHLPYIRAVLATYKLPPDIIALPFIESGYDTQAYSPVGAGGMWQFMPATARRFGLNIDWWVDERRNPYLSTVAAAKYLSELYAQFNDWNLALAAYNCGEGKMCQVISQSGQNDFFDIAKNPNLLKQETRHYVPKFLAVLKIFKNLGPLGFKPVDWSSGPVIEELPLKGGTDLAALAAACSMSWEEFHALNSGFRRQVSPPDRDSQVYVPVAKKELALAYLNNPSCVANRGIKSYTAAASDTWWSVSRRTGVPIAALREMNPSVGDDIGAGQTVYIPLDGSAQDTALADLDEKPAQRMVETARAQSHKFKKGETLAAIASRYGVSQAEILKANNLKSAHQVSIGRTLTIPGKTVAAACPPQHPGNQPVEARTEAKIEAKVEARTIAFKKGLTLAAVAEANKLDVKELMAANGLKSQKDARPGMILKIPAHTAPAQAPALVAAAGPLHETQGGNPAHVEPVRKPAGKEPHPNNGKLHTAAAAESSKPGTGLQAHASSLAPASHAAAKDAESRVKPAQPQPGVQAQAASQGKSAVKPGTTLSHSVENGETLWSIARKYKVDPNALLSWNNLDKPAQLKPGDRIKINAQ